MNRIVKKKVICPVCNRGRLMDNNDNVIVETIDERIMPDDFNPQYFEKCPVCKSTIAIKTRSPIEDAVREWVKEFKALKDKYDMRVCEKV